MANDISRTDSGRDDDHDHHDPEPSPRRPDGTRLPGASRFAEGAVGDAFGRRSYLKAGLGAGVGLAAISGLGGAKIISPPKLDGMESEDEGDEEYEPSGEEIDPVFGFSALSPEVEPPVEPDHEVQALIRPREGVPIPEFFFEPAGLAIEPGDTVKFNMATPHHNVVAYHPGFGYAQRVPDDVPPFSGPLLPAGGYWLYTFEQEGVYEVNCAPHEVFGMVMRLVVGDIEGPAAEPLPDLCAGAPDGDAQSGHDGHDHGGEDGNGNGNGGNGSNGGGDAESDEEPELRLPPFTAYTVLTDPALSPERIADRGSVSWEEIDAASKRLFLQASGFPPCGE